MGAILPILGALSQVVGIGSAIYGMAASPQQQKSAKESQENALRMNQQNQTATENLLRQQIAGTRAAGSAVRPSGAAGLLGSTVGEVTSSAGGSNTGAVGDTSFPYIPSYQKYGQNVQSWS